MPAKASAARKRLRRSLDSRNVGEANLLLTDMAANLFAAPGLSIANLPTALPKPQSPEPQRVETIGDRVAQARRRYGVTVKADILPTDLARMIDVPTSTISRVESGERQPGERLVQKIAKALGVTPAWLRYGAEPGMQLPVNGPDAGKGGPDAGR